MASIAGALGANEVQWDVLFEQLPDAVTAFNEGMARRIDVSWGCFMSSFWAVTYGGSDT